MSEVFGITLDNEETAAEIEREFVENDKDGDGLINEDEFQDLLEEARDNTETEEEITPIKEANQDNDNEEETAPTDKDKGSSELTVPEPDTGAT